MDLLSIADKAFEKTAGRSWKANIGMLGEKSKSILQSVGILDHGREMQGLNTGSANIIHRYGGEVTNMNSSQMTKHVTNAVSEEIGIKDLGRMYGSSPKVQAQQTMMMFNASNGHVTIPIGRKPIVNKGNTLPTSLDTGIKDHKDYTNALIHRHEADELRYSMQARANSKKSVNAGGSILEKTRFGNTGHMSPKVIIQESANVAIAPKEIKEQFVKARTDPFMGAGEAPGLKQDSIALRPTKKPFEYGVSGKVDTDMGVTAENAWIKHNKAQYNDIANMVDTHQKSRYAILNKGNLKNNIRYYLKD